MGGNLGAKHQLAREAVLAGDFYGFQRFFLVVSSRFAKQM